MKEIDRIQALSNVFGPSGFEDEVSELVVQELPEYTTIVDSMRNVRIDGKTTSGKPVVMFDAHLDEVGLIVQAIKPNGTMRILALGGIQAASLVANSFRIKTDKGTYVSAVVAAKPPHFMSAQDKNAPLDVSTMVLDCGTTSKEETEALGIHIGSPCAPEVNCTYDEIRDVFYGKAFDCRIGVAAEIETMKRLKGKDLPCDVSASFSVQEEVGGRGQCACLTARCHDLF